MQKTARACNSRGGLFPAHGVAGGRAGNGISRIYGMLTIPARGKADAMVRQR